MRCCLATLLKSLHELYLVYLVNVCTWSDLWARVCLSLVFRWRSWMACKQWMHVRPFVKWTWGYCHDSSAYLGGQAAEWLICCVWIRRLPLCGVQMQGRGECIHISTGIVLGLEQLHRTEMSKAVTSERMNNWVGEGERKKEREWSEREREGGRIDSSLVSSP